MTPIAHTQPTPVSERLHTAPPAAPAPADAPPGGPAPAPRFDYAAERPQISLPMGVGRVAIVLALAVAALFAWTFFRLWDRWHAPSGYYSHGPLVLPIAIATGWLILRHRGLPLDSTRGSRALGLAVVIPALLVHLACMYARVTFMSGFALIAVLIGMVLYLGGRPMLARLWFPIVFLAFMVPLPDVTVGDINFRLKLIAASAATWIVNALGVVAILNGSDIILADNKRLTVEDACSGLRSLISLLAFATLFTYACKLRGYKRALLFLSAVPIAIAANIVRIGVLTVASAWKDPSIAMPGGWLHDSMGFLVFVIAFCIMFFLEELLDLLPGAKSGKWLTSAPAKPAPATAPSTPAAPEAV